VNIYQINKGYSAGSESIRARALEEKGEWLIFKNNAGETIAWRRASKVYAIDRIESDE
jgi:hypothetical protein